MRYRAYRFCAILAAVALGIAAGCNKTKKADENDCADYCDKGIECLPEQVTLAQRQTCIDTCETDPAPAVPCRVACDLDLMCEMWVACIDLCTQDVIDADSGAPVDAGDGDAGAAAEACEGYTPVGDKDMDRCCRVTNPCGWDGDFYCDCLGACAWEESDCSGVVDAG